MSEHLKLNNMANYLTWALLFILFILIFVAPRMVNHDASMYLEIGEKLLDGQRPYVDYEEINFPLIHYISSIPALVGRLIGQPSTTPFMVLVWGMVALSVWACGYLLRRSPILAFAVPLGIAAYSLHLFATVNYGQREHLFILALLPWLALRTARRDGETVAVWVAYSVGIMVGLGVALKPFFVLVAVIPELIDMARSRKLLLWTPEVFGVATVAIGHITFFALNPDILNAFLLMLQRTAAAYDVYSFGLFAEVSVIEVALVLLGAGLIMFWYVRYPTVRGITPPFILSCAALMAAGVFSYLLQAKGWVYHAIPYQASNLVIFIWGASFLSQQKRVKHSQPTVLLVIAAVLGLLWTASNVVTSHRRGDILFAYLPTLNEQAKISDRIMIVYTGTFPLYPVIPGLGLRSASRYAVAHPLPFAYHDYEGLPYTDPRHIVPEYAQVYLDHFENDMALHQPSVVIIGTTPCMIACNFTAVTDLHDYLDARGILAEVIAPDYDFLTVDNGFHIYIRKGIAHNP